MLDDPSTDVTVARLRLASKDLDLSDSARLQACDLADRLTRGVRIVLMGPKSTGKSALCDAFFCNPEPSGTQTETRVFAPEVPELADIPLGGTLRYVETSVAPFGPAQVVDMAVPENFERYEEQVAEGLEFADIVLWCTQSFEPEETALWADACDALKDHSFLVLTKADCLAEEGVLQERLASLHPIASEEFHSIVPVMTSHVRQAQTDDQEVTDGQIAASGLKALTAAVEGIVRSGQLADIDSALLFLARYGKATGAELEEAASAQDGYAKEPVPEEADASTPRFAAAREILMQRAFDLAELGFDEADGDLSAVLELCSEVSVDFVDRLQGDAEDHPYMAPWCLAFEEASDKIMLMTMENDTRSAADAVTILLQLRRDIDQLSCH